MAGLRIGLEKPATRCPVLDDWVIVTVGRTELGDCGATRTLGGCDGAKRCGAGTPLNRANLARVGCPLPHLDWLEIRE